MPMFYHRSHISLPVLVICSLIALAGCELLGDDPTPGIENIDQISYDQHIQRIFNNRCTSCHAGPRAKAGLSLESWSHLIQGSASGEAIIAYSADDSRLIRMLERPNGSAHPVDKKKERLTTDELTLLRTWVETGAKGPLGVAPFSSSSEQLYVAHADEPFISILDMDAQLVSRRVDLVDLGFSSRARAHHVAVEPDGSFWYATIGSYRVGDKEGVIKMTRQNELVDLYELDDPGLLEIHPSRDVLHVSREQRKDGLAPKLVELRRSDLQAVNIPLTFEYTHALAIRPQADYLFSASMDADQIVMVDLATLDVSYYGVRGIEHSFRDFVISPNGNRMWGTGVQSGAISLFTVANPPNILQRQSLWVGYNPQYLAYLPDASKVYVTVQGANRIAVVNDYLEILDDPIEHDSFVEPVGITASSSGRYVFVTSKNSSGDFVGRDPERGAPPVGVITVIDTIQNEVVKTIEIGPGPTTIAKR